MQAISKGKVTFTELKRWNSLSNCTIYPGQELFIANPCAEQ